MKKIISILLCIVLGMGLILVGCSKDGELNRAKKLIDDYYDLVINADADAALLLFAQETINAATSLDNMVNEIKSRTVLMGGIKEYTLVRSTQIDGGYNLNYSTRYEYGTLDETFIVGISDGDVEIISASLAQEIKSSVFISEFFKAYGEDDYKTAMQYFNASYLNELTEDGFSKLLDAVKSILGEYKSATPMMGSYVYDSLSSDVTTLVMTQYRLNGEKSKMIVQIQLGIEDGNLGFTYLNFYPATIYEINEIYAQNVINGDIEGLLNMYSDLFYETVNGGKGTWQQIMIQMREEFGMPESYNLGKWSLVEVDTSDGKKYDGVSMDIVRTFNGGMSFNETIVVIDENGQYKIYLHTFSDASQNVIE